MSKFLIVMCICGIFATVTVLRGTRWVPWCTLSKNKTLNSDIISVVFFNCFKNFKCLGDVLASVTPITICDIEVPSFGRLNKCTCIHKYHMVYSETGEIPLSLHVKCRIGKYWSRLITCQSKKLSYFIYMFIYSLHINNIYHSRGYYLLGKYYVIVVSRGYGKPKLFPLTPFMWQ